VITTQPFIDELWDESIVPALIDYIRIPNKSPMFDPDWQAHGHMDAAVKLIASWCEGHAAQGMFMEVIQLPGRTPLIYIDIPGQGDGCVLLYGHLDKQPEMSGWRDGLGPWQPALIDDRLYGRGGADDGYAAFAALTAVLALQKSQRPHTDLKIIIEASEESGSPDLPFYVDALAERLGQPDLVVCLDSGCGNYDQLWCTTSLRGLVGGTVSIDVLTEGVHSGDAGGIVPSSFRVLRALLSRIEDEASGHIGDAAFNTEIPEERRAQAGVVADVLNHDVFTKFPFAGRAEPVAGELAELVLNRTWRPALEITGIGGIPPLADAGNVLRPRTRAKLSLRIPPNCDAQTATARLRDIMLTEPPYGASMEFESDAPGNGWNAPPLAPWLGESLHRASLAWFSKPPVYMGEGGTIPFMAMLGRSFADAQFLITGVLGPHSNAHGPNEFLHIPTGKRVTGCVAQVLADHYVERNG
jgi:acetylornithine deacetylase/succinyl-diaminopimelate desuccinylase-like protein